VAGNPRIDDLRKRLEKDPGSRLFAQLAEELRKDGELDEAIQVARAGLKQHSNYPSARMTLGRALLDTGDWAAAKSEFESVLAGAPDNILASRYIADCLESLGDREGALARFKATLAMAPGEKHVLARIQDLEKSGVKPSALPPVAGLRPPTTGAFARPGTATFARPAAIPTAAPAVRPATPPPPPAAVVMRPPTPAAPPPVPPPAMPPEEPPEAAPPVRAQEFAPIPLVDADEEFELERPYESPPTGIGTGTAPPPPAAAPVVPPPVAPTPPPPVAVAPPAPVEPIPLSPVEDAEFELESPYEAPAAAWKPAIPPLPPPEPEPGPAPMPAAASAPPPAEVAAGPEPQGSLMSPTLGELYFNQGFTEKAIEVYRALSGREPGNERLAARLKELEALQRTLGGPPAAAATSPAPPVPEPALPVPMAPSQSLDAAGERRQAIERTIGRLEGLLAAIRKG